jgi:hypothetical protein
MADQIQELIAGQAPTLMQAEKGNELIQAINAIKRSRGLNGIEVKIDKAGELVITQTAPPIERNFTFIFANGESWTARAEDIFPSESVEFWSLKFYIDTNTGTVDHAYANYPENPVTFEEEEFGFNGTIGMQTYTKVPIIDGGRYVNTGGMWIESTICIEGRPAQIFVKI